MQMCVGYTLNGVAMPLGTLPADLDQLAQCEPIYETLPGWSDDLAKCKRRADLPPNAERFMARIEQIIGGKPCAPFPFVCVSDALRTVRISHIGVGPGREETIQ
jgi:adenylosuccinate synthase